MNFAKIFERDGVQIVVIKGMMNGVGFVDFLFSFENTICPYTVNVAADDLQKAFDDVDEDVAFGAMAMFLVELLSDAAKEEDAS